MKDLYRRLVQQGLRMVCIVTKVDLIDAHIEADTSNVVFSAEVHHLRQFVSAETGMPANQVSLRLVCTAGGITVAVYAWHVLHVFPPCLVNGGRMHAQRPVASVTSELPTWLPRCCAAWHCLRPCLRPQPSHADI